MEYRTQTKEEGREEKAKDICRVKIEKENNNKNGISKREEVKS